MSDMKLSSEIKRFKEFINQHPKLIKRIRKEGKAWQEIYEQWILLGEDDVYWKQFDDEPSDDRKENKENKEKKSPKVELSKDVVKQIMKYTESIDIKKINEQVQQLGKTVGIIQEVVEQFQSSNKSKDQDSGNPFQWFND